MKNITFILSLIIIISSLLIVPLPLDLRAEKTCALPFVLLLVGCIYILLKIELFLGLCGLWICLISYDTFVEQPIYLSVWLSVVIFIIILYETYTKWNSYKDILLDSICFIALINYFWQVLQFFDIWIGIKPLNPFFYVGFMTQYNEISCLYAVCLPAFFRKGRWIFLLLIIIGLILSKAYQGIVTAIIIMLFWIIFNSKKIINIPICTIFTILMRWKPLKLSIPIYIPIILLIIYIPIFFHSYVRPFDLSHNLDSRGRLWKATIEVSLINPLGVGLGKYLFYDEKLKYVNDRAHNEYLELLYTGGFLGLLLGIFSIFILLINSYYNKDKIPFYGLIGSLTCALFGFPYHLVPVVIVTLIWIVIIIQEKNYDLC
jgi:hypothetical protein